MPFVNVDGKQIYYEEYGCNSKPTLVYFHGGPGKSYLSFTHQAKIFCERYHTIIFDQYGVFRYDDLNESEIFGVYDHADLIEKLRIALGINSWIVLGHSYGGMLACQYAYMYPESIDAVIYDCPMWNVLLTSKTVVKTVLPYFEAKCSNDKIKICNEILANSISPQEAFEQARAIMNLFGSDEQLHDFCHVISNSVYEKYLTDFIPAVDVPEHCWYKFIDFTKKLLENGDFYNDYLCCLKEIKKPSLLIVGEYDMTCGKDQQEWFCKYSENGKFVILEQSAHLSWIQCPEKYTRIISDFIDNCVAE